MNKVKKLSHFLRVVFQIFFVLQPIILLAFWVNPSFWLAKEWFNCTDLLPSYIQILHPLSYGEQILGFLISAFAKVVTMLILYFLIKLFQFYEQGEIFTKASITYIRNIGILMLAGQFVGFCQEILLGIVLTMHNPVGHRLATITFDSYNLHFIVTAIIIILISWIMGEGVRLQEEQKYTV